MTGTHKTRSTKGRGISRRKVLKGGAATLAVGSGLMTSLARELGEYGIRVNSVNPTCVDTDMINNPFVYGLFRPDLDQPSREDVVDSFTGTHILPVPWIEPSDVSNAILYLVSDAGRYITASTMVVDAGFIVKS